jgi:hypothetical protein
MLLIIAASILVIGVVASLVWLLWVELRRLPQGERLAGLKAWQGLIGSVLGLLGGAGVLVLGTAISSAERQQQELKGAHAIGLGLALEAEKLSTGLVLGREVGKTIDFSEAAAGDLPQACLFFSQALQRALVPGTPVYEAVLPRMVEFGDDNLAMFVRFYALYLDLIRGLKQIDQAACNDEAESEIRYIVSQVDLGMRFYHAIAERYGVAPPAQLPPAEGASS